jgi:hypothetical protein
MNARALRLGGWLFLAGWALAACAKNERHDEPRGEPRCDCAPAERVVDPALLAFLSQARSAHHVADLKEAAGDQPAAIRALAELTDTAKPPGTAPEVDEVLADTRARLADLLSQAGQFDRAEAEVVAGLEHARARTYFRGHLFEVRGLLEERREKALRVKGHGQEADRARERSLGAYEEAMKIQAQVIEKSIDQTTGRGAPAPSAPK